MPGASAKTLRVINVNANWVAGDPGEDGGFEFLLITEDGERHTVAPSVAAASALLRIVRLAPVLLWDPDNRTLIGANIVGQTVPDDWSGVTGGVQAT